MKKKWLLFYNGRKYFEESQRENDHFVMSFDLTKKNSIRCFLQKHFKKLLPLQKNIIFRISYFNFERKNTYFEHVWSNLMYFEPNLIYFLPPFAIHKSDISFDEKENLDKQKSTFAEKQLFFDVSRAKRRKEKKNLFLTK